jgi:hypothetical protein
VERTANKVETNLPWVSWIDSARTRVGRNGTVNQGQGQAARPWVAVTVFGSSENFVRRPPNLCGFPRRPFAPSFRRRVPPKRLLLDALQNHSSPSIASPNFLHTSSYRRLPKKARRMDCSWDENCRPRGQYSNPVDGMIATHPRNRIKCCGRCTNHVSGRHSTNQGPAHRRPGEDGCWSATTLQYHHPTTRLQ